MGTERHYPKLDRCFTKLGIALLLMSAAIAIAGSMSESEATQGLNVISDVLLMITLLVAVSGRMPIAEAAELASMFKALGVALILMGAAVKLLGGMDRNDMDQGLFAVTIFGALLAGIVSVISSNAAAMTGVAASILAITFSIGLMVGISKLAAKLKPEEFAAGAKAIGIFGGMMAALVVIVTRYGGPNAIKIGGTVAALSIGIAALIAVAILCGYVDTSKGKKTVKQAIDEIVGYARDYILGLTPIDFSQLFQNGLDSLAKVKDRFFETMTGLKTDAQSTGNALTDFIQGINWKPLLSMAGAVGALVVIKKFSDNLNTLSKTIANVSKPFSTFDPLVQALSKTVLTFKSLLGGVNLP